MADSGSEDESIPKIVIKLKTIQETYEQRVKQASTIEEIKNRISKKINQPTEKICLIFSGKILKDYETLDQHKIKDGMVIHMVIKNVKPQQSPQSRESTPSSASSSLAQPAAAAPSPAEAPLGGMGAMLNNPMLRDMLNSPLMENLLSNPQMTNMMRQMLEQNPQFQNVIQNNPELGHILNDPQIMQQTIEMIRNPNMFNELMRNHDQAIRNIQGIPGGEAALHRLYQEVQEPLMNSVLGTPGSGNQYATDGNNTNGQNNPQQQASRSQHAGVENAEALPNPWSRVVNQQQQAPGAGGVPDPGRMPFVDSPGMQSLMRQVFSNPAAMQTLFSPDNMRHLGQMFGNPAMADQLRTSLGNPQIMQAMSNPRVLNALMQMQQAIQVLNEEMPGVFPNLPGAEIFQNLGVGGNLFANQNQQQQPSNASNTSQPNADQPSTNTASAGSGPAQSTNMGAPAGIAELLRLMNLANNAQAGAGIGQGAAAQPPEERYRTQLEQLTAMGFANQQANIQALLASYGDVNLAIERLLGSGGDRGGDPPE